MQISDTEYQALADRLAPKSKPLQNCLRAFLCGGAICVLGQGLLTAWQAAGLPADRAATYLADSEGSTVMYDAIAEATCSMRSAPQGMPISGNWKEKVERDTAKRGLFRRR